MIGINKKKKKKNYIPQTKKSTPPKSLKQKLHDIYYKTVNLDTTCNGRGECCKTAMPQINYSEFSQLINEIWDKSSKSEKIEMICTSVEYFFKNEFEKFGMETLVKKCMLLAEDGKCKYYNSRPLNCFHPNTWVYTLSGPTKISEILAGDKIYGKDGELHDVISTYSRLYSGYLYNIRHQGNHIYSECSEDHKWLTVFHKDRRIKINPIWSIAKDLVVKRKGLVGNYLSFPVKFNDQIVSPKYLNVLDFIDGNEDNDTIVPFTSGRIFSNKTVRAIPKQIKIDSNFLFMIGLYLAEGSSSSQSTTFSMNTKEKEHLERIANYLAKYNIPSHYNKIKNGKNVIVLRVDSCLFARLMSELCGKLANQKKLNNKLFETLSNKDKYEIYKAWNIGDGRNNMRFNEFSTVTISEKLAIQMSQILVLNGIFPRIYRSKRFNRGFCNYDVHVFPSSMGEKVKRGQGTKIMADKEYIYVPLDDVEKREYCGPLIDIQVKDSESFITTSGIAHNCRLYGLWPEKDYTERVDKFEKAYSDLGLKRKDLPLNTQCPNVKRVDESKELTTEVINNLFAQLDVLDAQIGGFSSLKIQNKENYRTFHDWLLLKVFGEDFLIKFTTFMLAANKNVITDQIKVLRDVIREKFAKDMPVIK